jgi:prepilin-type N-terminal cleavage/methylation domain-containing protein
MRRAFTLMEVLVVVVILGIAAAVVVPQIGKPGTLTVQAAARSIVSDILTAQNESVARHASYTVSFDPTGNSYKIVDAGGTTLAATWKTNGVYETDFDIDRRFEGVRISAADFSGKKTLSFDELGSPSSGGTVDVTASGISYRITVSPFTGRVTVAPLAGG